MNETIRVNASGHALTVAETIGLWGILLSRYRAHHLIQCDVAIDDGPIQSLDINFEDDPAFLAVTREVEKQAGIGGSFCGRVSCRLPEDVFQLARIRDNGTHPASDPPFLLFEFVNKTGTWTFQYSRGTAEESAMQRLARHYENLLVSATQAPDTPSSQLEMMSREETQTLLRRGVGPTKTFQRTTIPERFADQVQRAPNAPALHYGDFSVTYMELFQKVNRMAGSLSALGVGPEMLVGVHLADPFATAITYLGIVTAGGVLVALDLEWPPERLRQVVTDAGLRLIVTDRNLDGLPRDCPAVSFETLAEGNDQADVASPRITPDSAAYVIFTSGSTGTPKGVVGLHRTVTSAAAVARHRHENEIFAVSARLSLGAGVLGLFFPLMVGSTALLVPHAIAKDLPTLVRLYEERGVTRIVAVPPQIRHLRLLGPEVTERLKKIRIVFFSGAALTSETLADAYALFPDAMIGNVYSCLEIGTMSSQWESWPDNRRMDVSVGRTLPNIRIYILGPRLNSLPEGMPGEIYVGSEELSRGYLNGPELTSARFLPDPFVHSATERMYRTGDIGRFLPNGDLEYLGRVDNQAKVRGFRIEPEEIEAALQKLPQVHLAAVIAKPHGSESQLVAFISLNVRLPAIGTSVIRTHLQGLLPPYMVPSIIVIVKEMPLLGNGKIDRQGLLRLGGNRPEIDTPYVAARDSFDALIVQTWERELGVNGIGIDDHFLMVGGDSLLAVRIVASLKKTSGIGVPPMSLFEHGSVRGLSDQLRLASAGNPFPGNYAHADSQ